MPSQLQTNPVDLLRQEAINKQEQPQPTVTQQAFPTNPLNFVAPRSGQLSDIGRQLEQARKEAESILGTLQSGDFQVDAPTGIAGGVTQQAASSPVTDTELTQGLPQEAPTRNTPPGATPADESAFIGGLNLEGLDKQIEGLLAPEATEAKTERGELRNRLTGALEKLGLRGQRQQDIEGELGVKEDVKKLQDIREQIAQRTAQFNRAFEVSEGRLAPTPQITGEQAQIRRQQAVEIGALASVAQAVQGNIQLAQDTAERTVDLEFEPLEREIEALQLELDFNRENLSEEEQQRATRLEIALDERSRLLQDAKQERQQVLNLAMEAAQNGASPQVYNGILKSSSLEEAIQQSGEFVSEESRASIVSGQTFVEDTQTGKVSNLQSPEDLADLLATTSRAELAALMDRDTKLNKSTINDLLDQAERVRSFQVADKAQIAKQLIASNFKDRILTTRTRDVKDAKQKALDLVSQIERAGSMKLNGTPVPVTPEQIQEIRDAIENITSVSQIRDAIKKENAPKEDD